VLVSKLQEIVEGFVSPLPLDFLQKADLESVAATPTSTRLGRRRRNPACA
jgi:hypothetical protein